MQELLERERAMALIASPLAIIHQRLLTGWRY